MIRSWQKIVATISIVIGILLSVVMLGFLIILPAPVTYMICGGLMSFMLMAMSALFCTMLYGDKICHKKAILTNAPASSNCKEAFSRGIEETLDHEKVIAGSLPGSTFFSSDVRELSHILLSDFNNDLIEKKGRMVVGDQENVDSEQDRGFTIIEVDSDAVNSIITVDEFYDAIDRASLLEEEM